MTAGGRRTAGHDGVRVRQLRERLGLSQREMAAEFNVTSSAIALWEGGQREMPGPALRLLELYERASNSQASADPDEYERPISTSRVGRSLASAAASLSLVFLRQFKVTEDTSPIAQRVRSAMARRFIQNATEMRGLAAKLVQMVSYMDVVLPDAERALCASLEQERPPLSTDRLNRIFESELRGRPAQLFASWSARSFAVGSIGQVHDATLRSGERVVVKVQYPEIVDVLRADLMNIKFLEQCTQLLFRGQRTVSLFAEMRERFLEECDYALEADRLVRFRQLFAGRVDLDFPKPFPEYSTPRILTMSRLSGVPFETFVRNASQEARDRAATSLWSFQFESVLRHRLFNTDPHTGNLLFGDNQVKVVDFGRVKELSPHFARCLHSLLRSILERNHELFARALLDMGTVADPKRFDYAYAFRGLVYVNLPFLRDEPFLYTTPFVRQMWSLFTGDNANRSYSTVPADAAFFHQLVFGMSAVLARLGGRAAYRPLMLGLLYDEGESRPAPYSEAELRALGIDTAIGI